MFDQRRAVRYIYYIRLSYCLSFFPFSFFRIYYSFGKKKRLSPFDIFAFMTIVPSRGPIDGLWRERRIDWEEIDLIITFEIDEKEPQSSLIFLLFLYCCLISYSRVFSGRASQRRHIVTNSGVVANIWKILAVMSLSLFLLLYVYICGGRG